MPNNQTLDVEAVYAAFRNVRLHIGLALDEVRITGQNVRVAREPFSIELERQADVEIEIAQESIAAFLEQQSPGGLRNFKVRCADGKIYVEAVVRILLEVQASAICTLRIDSGKRLYVELEEVNVLGSGPKELVQKRLDSINPVFNMDELPIQGQISRAEVSNGKVVLYGTLGPLAK